MEKEPIKKTNLKLRGGGGGITRWSNIPEEALDSWSQADGIAWIGEKYYIFWDRKKISEDYVVMDKFVTKREKF